MRLRLNNIPIGLYKTRLEIYAGSFRDFSKYIKSTYGDEHNIKTFENIIHYIEEDEDSSAMAASTYWCSKARLAIVYIPRVPKGIQDICVTAHEVSHVVFNILDDVGISTEVGNSEAFTYLQEYLLKNALDKKKYEMVE